MTEDEITIRALGWESYISFLRGRGMSYEAIGKKTNRSGERIRQVHMKHLRRQKQIIKWVKPARPYLIALAELGEVNADRR